MKVKVPIYQTKKILLEENEFEMPDEESYYFQTGVRKSIRFTPIWSTWHHEKGEPEIIFQYHITIVYLSLKNKVESFKLSAISGLSELYNLNVERWNSEQSSVIKALFDKQLDVRTKEQFENDLKMAIYNFNNI